jgi:dimethylglycine dehydrogenase
VRKPNTRWFLQHQEDGVTTENISDNLNAFRSQGQNPDLLAACYVPVIWLI